MSHSNKKKTNLRFVGMTLLIVWIACLLIVLDPYEIVLANILSTPSLEGRYYLEGLLGYDELGRSLFARLIYGAIPACTIAVLVVIFSMLIGVSIGFFAAFLGGWVDQLIMRIIDVFLAFPGLLLAIILSGLLGPGLFNVVIALCTVGWVGFARISRAQALGLRNQDFIFAAIAQGQKKPTLLFRHVMPLVSAPLLVEATFAFAGSILAEAGLSFLGLGIQPPGPSWGQMIRIGAQYMLTSPHYVLIPSTALWLSVLCITRFGDHLQLKLKKLSSI